MVRICSEKHSRNRVRAPCYKKCSTEANTSIQPFYLSIPIRISTSLICVSAIIDFRFIILCSIVNEDSLSYLSLCHMWLQVTPVSISVSVDDYVTPNLESPSVRHTAATTEKIVFSTFFDYN